MRGNPLAEAPAGSPDWQHDQMGGFVTGAHASINLASPKSAQHVPETLIFLDVQEDDDLQHQERYTWRVSTDEESAGFGEAEIDAGVALDFESAKRSCLDAALVFLTGEGYSDHEIFLAL